MAREPEIIDDEIIVVDEVQPVDSGGYLSFTDKDGEVYKINQKHEHLHPLIQEGKAIQLFFAEYNGNVYIHKAKAVETPEAKAPIKQDVQEGEPPPPSTSKKLKVSDGDKLKQIVGVFSYSLSYAKDMATSGVIGVDSVKPQADDFVDWFMLKLKKYL